MANGFTRKAGSWGQMMSIPYDHSIKRDAYINPLICGLCGQKMDQITAKDVKVIFDRSSISGSGRIEALGPAMYPKNLRVCESCMSSLNAHPSGSAYVVDKRLKAFGGLNTTNTKVGRSQVNSKRLS